MGDSDFDFDEWLKVGYNTGMFDFSAPIFKDHNMMTYEEAISFLNDLAQQGTISTESGMKALEKADVSSYFMGLVEEDWSAVQCEAIGTRQIPGWKYVVTPESTHEGVWIPMTISVIVMDDMFQIIEGRTSVAKFKTKEEAGSYILKWILGYLNI